MMKKQMEHSKLYGLWPKVLMDAQPLRFIADMFEHLAEIRAHYDDYLFVDDNEYDEDEVNANDDR